MRVKSAARAHRNNAEAAAAKRDNKKKAARK
jgi:hypothetical protein